MEGNGGWSLQRELDLPAVLSLKLVNEQARVGTDLAALLGGLLRLGRRLSETGLIGL